MSLTRRDFFRRVGSRETVRDLARAVRPLWHEVSSIVRLPDLSVDDAVAALQARASHGPNAGVAGAEPGTRPTSGNAAPPCPGAALAARLAALAGQTAEPAPPVGGSPTC